MESLPKQIEESKVQKSTVSSKKPTKQGGKSILFNLSEANSAQACLQEVLKVNKGWKESHGANCDVVIVKPSADDEAINKILS
jgi:hypothetical protein